MELIGDVSAIIYKNEENNYTIATVVVEQDVYKRQVQQQKL